MNTVKQWFLSLLKKQKNYAIDFKLASPMPPEAEVDFSWLGLNPRPEMDFSGFKVSDHLGPELMSYLPKAKENGALALDLGCGEGLNRKICQYAGYEYVGLDFKSPQADVLGDAHSLPFKEQSFDFVISLAVLEHLLGA